MKRKKAIRILSALAQETRVDIYKLLVQESPQGMQAGVIAEILQVPAATLSFHLAQMANAGLLSSEKEGRNVRYAVKNKSLKNLFKFLTENSYKKRLKHEEDAQPAPASTTTKQQSSA